MISEYYVFRENEVIVVMVMILLILMLTMNKTAVMTMAMIMKIEKSKLLFYIFKKKIFSDREFYISKRRP